MKEIEDVRVSLLDVVQNLKAKLPDQSEVLNTIFSALVAEYKSGKNGRTINVEFTNKLIELVGKKILTRSLFEVLVQSKNFSKYKERMKTSPRLIPGRSIICE